MSSIAETHLVAASARDTLARDVRDGLAANPKQLPSKWFYDERGSRLFDQITRLPEYYPTRAEKAALRPVPRSPGCRLRTLVELGSGTSEKTRLLLSALQDAGTLQRFVPVDVDASVLEMAGEAVAGEYPDVRVAAVVADFERHLPLLPRDGRRMIAFLGSTIGNLLPSARAAFLADVRTTLAAGETFLLGTDLVKDPDRLVAAYDDAAGVTAAFNRNVLTVVNRELDADFDVDSFSHVAVWDAEHSWIEMRLRSRLAQVVRLRALDLVVRFDAGEQIRTEISAKFTRERVESELDAAGLRLLGWWTDPDGDVALSLSRPT